MNYQSIVIVGSGIAGLLAALLAKSLKPNTHVVLLEKSDKFGGLLGSTKLNNQWFDHGTHVMRYTGTPEIDELLFSSLDLKQFRRFRNINAANVGPFNSLYTDSPNAYLASPENVNKGKQFDELLSASKSERNFSNLYDQLISWYGTSLTEEFFTPILQKRFGKSPKQLASGSHNLIGLARLILGSEAQMREYKNDPKLDKVLAFTSQHEGLSELINMYPSDGNGVGIWVNSLTERLVKLGVQLIPNIGIKHFEFKNKRVEKVGLTNNIDIDCETLIWTAPLPMLIKLSPFNYSFSQKPTFRTTTLFHFLFSEAPLIKSNYVNVFDPEFKSFRVTLYTNLSGCKTSEHRITVEVMHDSSESPPSSADICKELRIMGIIDEISSPSYSHVCAAASGFPVLTPDFVKEMEKQSTFVANNFNNVITLGKASGSAFFMADVLNEVYRKIKFQYEDASSESLVPEFR